MAAAFSLTIMSLPIAAAFSRANIWNGMFQPESGKTYYIDTPTTLKGSFEIPADTKLNIIGGGNLIIPSDSVFGVYGDVSVEPGGAINVQGKLAVADSGSLYIAGNIGTSSASSFVNGGKMLTDAYSDCYFGGKADFSEKSELYSAGSMCFAGGFNAASAITFEGDAEFSAASVVKNTADITFNSGFSITNGAVFKNYGNIELTRDCKYTLDGRFNNLGDGKTGDNRKTYSDIAMSVENLSLNTCEPFKIIDVSYAQGENIDWARVKASGINHAVIRSSRGRLNDDYPMTVDSCFHINMLGALNNDVNVGVYHYCYAETVEEARAEAKFVLSLIQDYDITMPIAFDIEDEWYIKQGYSRETLTAMTQAFCDEIAKAGYLPVIYTYAGFLYYHLDMSRLDKYPVWVAHVNTDKPDYDGEYFLWQYSWEGRIDGINGDVDMSMCYLDFPKYIKENGLNKLN